MKLYFLSILFIILFTNISHAQTPGMIYEPATGGGSVILDPNGDGFTSATPAGFISNDDFESEIPYRKLIFPSIEPTSDLGPGPDCGFTDFVDQPNQDPCQNFLDALNNWLFRFRMGGTSPNSKSYSVLIDIDQKFGSSGPNADPNYVVGNPGFEIEIVLATNFGVYIYDVDGKNSINPPVLKKSYLGHSNYQKSIALSSNCGDPDYFYDFFIPFSDLTTYFGITPSTPLRFAIIDNMAAQASTIDHSTSASDLGGVNDATCNSLESCYNQIIDNYTPCSPNSSSCTDRSLCPTVNAPINAGATSISGTSLEPDGTVITVYLNEVAYGTTTIVTSGTWTLSGISPALSSGTVVGASATATGLGESYNNCSQVTVGMTCSANPTSAYHCGKSIQGLAPVAGAVINIYQGTSTTPVVPGGGTVFTTGSPNKISVSTLPSALTPNTDNFLFKCTNDGVSTGCNSAGPACLVNGAYRVTATENGKCESPGIWICVGGATATANPTITTNPILSSTTSISGTVASPDNVAGVAVYVYSNGTLIGNTTTAASGIWTLSGLSLSSHECETISVTAIRTATNLCPSTGSVTKVIQRKAYAPVINGPICSAVPVTSISGTSVEAAGTTIEIFENAVSKGTTTVAANGTWTKSGLSLALGSSITAKAYNTGCLYTSDASTAVIIGTKSTNVVTITSNPIHECDASVSGTGTDGDIITLYEDGFQIGSTAIVSGGVWTIGSLNTNCFLYTGGVVTATAYSTGKCEGNPSNSVTVVCVPPSNSLTVSPSNTNICSGSTVNVTIQNSESGIVYQLYNGSNASGTSKVGTGSNLTLTTSPITTATTITIKAIRLGTSCITTLANSVVVTVNNTITSAVLSGSTTICNGNSANLVVTITGGTSPYGVTINNGVGTITNYISGTNIPVSPSSTTTYALTSVIDDIGCSSSTLSGTPTVTVNSVPSNNPILTTDASPICSGTSTNINVPTANDGYAYQIKKQSDNSNLGTSFTGNGTTFSRSTGTLTSSETYYVEISNGTCLHNGSNTVTVNINPSPTAPTSVSASSTSICNGSSTTLSYTGGSGTTFAWYSGSCGGTLVGTGNNLSISPAANTTYYGRWENGTCYSACQTVAITVTAIPTAPTSVNASATTICNGSNTTLSYTGGSGTTFAWYSGSCGGTLVGTGNNLTVSPAATTTYYGRWENGTCYSACQSVTINVVAMPVDPTSASVDRNNFCSDDAGNISLSVTGGSGTQVAWYTSSCGGTSIGTGNPLSIASPATTTTYYTRWESGTCYSSCQSVTISVTSLPTDPTSVSASSTSICNGSSTTLSYTGGSGTTFVWYSGSCGGTLVGTGNNLSVSPSATTTYYGRWENGTCYSACQTVAITVTAIPTAPTSVNASATTICNGSNTTLSYTGGSGTTFAWYSGSCGGTLVGTGNNLSISPAANTTYYGRWENGTCYSACQTVAITVTAIPTAPTSVNASATTICNGSNTTLSYTGGSGTTFAWYSGSCGGTLVGTGNNLSVSPAATTTYYGRWENGTCYSACQSVTINVAAMPVDPTSASVDRNNFCSDDAGNISLSVTGGSGTQVAWYTSNCGGTLIGNGNPLSIASPVTTTTYYARWESGTCYSNCQSVTVTVIAAPIAPTSANVDRNNLCSNDAGNISLSVTGGSGTQVAWYTSSCGGTLVGTGNPLSIASPTTTTTYYARWENSTCYSSCENITVNVFDNPVSATLSGNSTICEGSFAVVTVNINDGTSPYDVTIDNSIGTINNYVSGNNIQVTPASTVTYNLVSVTDSHGCSTPSISGTAIITVNNCNNIPVAADDFETMNEDNILTSNVYSNDNGLGDTPINFTILSNVSHGTLAFNSNGTYIYTPNPNFNGTDSFEYMVCDVDNECSTAIVTITILPVNDPIYAGDDIATVNEDEVLNGTTVLANDGDEDGSTLTVNTTPVSGPSNGTLVLNADGTYTYTPNSNYNGTDQFTYQVCNDEIPQECTTATVSITITPVNDPIYAGDDIATVNEDEVLNGTTVLANDGDDDGSTLTVNTTPVSSPSNGTLVLNADGTYTYTPNSNYYGTDQFTYQVCNDEIPQECTTATVSITVLSVNDAPAINDTTVTTQEDNPITVCVPFTDIDGVAPYTASLACMNNGNATVNIVGNSACVTYTPDLNFNGKDTVCITLCDAGGACTTSNVIITVTPVNDPPVTTNETETTPEDTPLSGNILTSADTDPEGDALTVNTIPVDGPQNGTIIINSDGTYTYMPNPNYNGQDTVIASVCDNGIPQLCTNDTLFITVSPVNDAPAMSDTTVTTQEDNPITVCVPFTDVDGVAPYTASLACMNNGNATVNIIGNTACVTYTPDLNFNGKDTVCITLCDADGACTTSNVVITVTPVNDPPVTTNKTETTPEDTPLSGNILTGADTDPEGDALTVDTTPVDWPQNGTIIINSDGTYTYTPDLNYNGQDTVITSVCDNGIPQLCTNDTLFITITPVNDPPIANNDIATTDPNTPVGFNVGTNDSDIDGPNLVWTIIQQPDSGTAVIISGDSIVYTPNPGAGIISPYTDTLIYTVCDGGIPDLCDTAIVLIYVPKTPFPPFVTNEWATASEDQPITISILNNDYDPNGDVITTTSGSGNTNNGSYTIDSNGNLTYIPNPNFNGNDTIIIQVCDPTPLCTNDTIFINILPLNDPLVLTNDTVSTNEDTPVSGNIINSNDYDIDGTSLTVNTTPVVNPANGNISINPDGTFIYTPNNGFNGSDTAVFEVCDNGIPLPPTCSNDTLIIIVNPVNNPPAMNDTTITTQEDNPITVCVPFTDVDGVAPYTVSLACMNSGNATVNIVGNSACVTYTPNTNYNGNDTICITLCDAGGACTTSNIIITVTPVNDPPVVTNDTAYTTTNTPVNGNIISAGDYDPDGTNLSANTNPVFGPDNGNIIINPDGTYTYTPNNGFSGTDTIIVEICDQGIPLPPICVNDTLFINITPTNTPPYAQDTTVTIPMDSAVTICTTIFDNEGNEPYSASVACVDNGNATVVVNGNLACVTFTPNNGFVGTDSLCLILCDDVGSCDTSNIVVIVTPPGNTPPYAQDTTVTTPMDSAVTVCTTIFDNEGNGPYSASVACVDNGTASAVVNGNQVCVTFTPNVGFVGTDSLCLILCDAAGSCDTSNIVVIVLPPGNVPPVAVPDYATTNAETSVIIPILSNDYDVDGTINISSVSIVQGPMHGSVLNMLDGTTKYIPESGFIGTDFFIYKLWDNDVVPLSDTALVTIFIEPVPINIPSGFSPDGDGINDFFVIKGLEGFPEADLKIYNRWGNLVFEKSPYDNKWDGYSNANGVLFGSKLPEGTYFYILDLKNDKKSYSGYVILKR